MAGAPPPPPPPPGKPSVNIAVCLRGDAREHGDALHAFLQDPKRVATDDHTETVLLNAVKDVLQDPGTPGFAFNRVASPRGSFLRLDASIWIGMPGAPLNWDAGRFREGWHPNERWGTLKHVGHPAVDPDSGLTPVAASGSSATEQQQQQYQQPGNNKIGSGKRKRQRKDGGDNTYEGSSGGSEGARKKQKSSPPPIMDQNPEQVLPFQPGGVEEAPEEVAMPFGGFDNNNNNLDSQYFMPSSILDPTLLGDHDESLEPLFSFD